MLHNGISRSPAENVEFARLMRRVANRGAQNGWHMVRDNGVLRRVPTFAGPAREESRYVPHQGKRECARRRGEFRQARALAVAA